jgi:D-3-phosphoglycerate dehydrogenase
VPKAYAVLFENVHTSAAQALEAGGVSVTQIAKGVTPEQLIEHLRDVPGDEPILIGIRSKTKVRAAVFEQVPRLLGIGAFCIGTDQIDLDVARARGVVAFNAPFSSTRSVAELVVAEVVMLARQVHARSVAAHRGEWRKNADGAHEVRGKVLGIVGYGHIGSQVSILAESLGMSVQYYDVVTKLPLGNAQPVGSLEELLRAADFVSLHVPDTAVTRGMIGRAELAAMKPGASLLNLSRGKVVDIAALCEALDSGHVAGAGLDVFPSEPAKEGELFESPLRGRDNVILTPHIGGSTVEAQYNIGLEVAGKLLGYLDDGRTSGSVTLPELDEPRRPGTSRITSVHRNVPGVLSAITRVLADRGVNIVAQHLSTEGDVGLAMVDARFDDPAEASLVAAAIEALDANIRTRLLLP